MAITVVFVEFGFTFSLTEVAMWCELVDSIFKALDLLVAVFGGWPWRVRKSLAESPRRGPPACWCAFRDKVSV